jgi:hypothetical protein
MSKNSCVPAFYEIPFLRQTYGKPRVNLGQTYGNAAFCYLLLVGFQLQAPGASRFAYPQPPFRLATYASKDCRVFSAIIPLRQLEIEKTLQTGLSQWRHLHPTANLPHAYGKRTARYGLQFCFPVCGKGAQQCGTALLQTLTFDWYCFQNSSSK